ncbi:MAG: tRNA ((37)-N6)-dimethylallyltransferase MiaA [Actinomycetota bacterium]
MLSKVLAIVGPTASGKSQLALDLASELGKIGGPVEIINGDAMQLYKGMDIGTAKLPEVARQQFPHHLFDVLSPSDEMSALQYQEIARSKVLEIQARGNIAVFVGGSMFYISAALDGLDFSPTDPGIRARLEAECELVGALAMHARLGMLDPVTAAKIPSQNKRRVIRALEVIEITGNPYPSTLPEQAFWVPTIEIGISVERDVLKQRIGKRVHQMWEEGLVDEVSGLLATTPLSRTAKRAIGYDQAIRQLMGELSQDQAIEETIALTNRYARRQMSWFRRDRRIHWLDDGPGLVDRALQVIRLSV